MTEPTNAEVLQAILDLGSRMDREFEAVRAEQKAQADRLAHLEGQFTVAIQWLQSMDQRFTALMSPYQPPERKAG